MYYANNLNAQWCIGYDRTSTQHTHLFTPVTDSHVQQSQNT